MPGSSPARQLESTRDSLPSSRTFCPGPVAESALHAYCNSVEPRGTGINPQALNHGLFNTDYLPAERQIISGTLADKDKDNSDAEDAPGVRRMSLR